MARGELVLSVAALLCCAAVFTYAQERRTGNTCSNDMHCPDNAFCKSSAYCVCKDGYIIIPHNVSHRECIREASFGEQCREHIQCRSRLGVHAECLSGVCACKSTAHMESERCFETALIGERCTVTENCYLGEGSETEKQAFCVRGICQCTHQHSPRDGGSRCVKDALLGDKCEDQLQCAGTGLECRGGTCHCVDGWVPHDIYNTCLRSAKQLGDECEYDVQCDSLAGNAGAAMCLNGNCNCTWGARIAGEPERCWHKHRPGEDCKNNEECVSEEDAQGFCDRGRCTCATCVPDARDFSPSAGRVSATSSACSAILTVVVLLRYLFEL